jgi:CBS-domain-containing membrane protein
MTKPNETTTEVRPSIRDAMDRTPPTTTPDRPIEEVALALLATGRSGMVVLDAGGAPVGIVSEYDVLTKKGRTVGEIMSRGVISAGEGSEPVEIARLMGLHGIRLVPIVHEGRLVGVVSRADLMRRYATTHWRCRACGATERGLEQPARCAICDATAFQPEEVGA